MSGYYGQAQPPYGQQPYGQPLHAPQGYHQQPPPRGQYGQYGAPPPGQYGQPPAGQYGYPPQGQYGSNQPQYGQPQYGQPPSGPPAPPSLGYVPGQLPPMDMSREADGLRAAMKGFGTDEKALIAIVTRLDPLQVEGVKQAFAQRHKRDLIKDVHSETSGHFRDGLIAILRGPLGQDVHELDRAIAGLGTKEAVLNDVLLGRSNADIQAIKTAYHQTYRRSLESDVKGDLSMKTERLFDMVLAARRNEESTPVIPQQIDADVNELYHATEGTKVGCDQIAVCSIMTSKSDGQLRAISQAYQQKYHRSLEEVLLKNFSGHMEKALIFILNNAVDRAKHDASMLEDAMKGAGTKDLLLIDRLVRFSRDRARLQQARAAYKHFYKQDLYRRIQGETSGHYERLLVAVSESV